MLGGRAGQQGSTRGQAGSARGQAGPLEVRPRLHSELQSGVAVGRCCEKAAGLAEENPCIGSTTRIARLGPRP